MSISIRQIQSSDHRQWLQLWHGYLSFYKTELEDGITANTWTRLNDLESGIYGFCAVDSDGSLLGFVHYLFHPVTWSTKPRCYLEDLFTTEAARGKGVARKLIEAVYSAADAHGADQVYWLTEDNNHAARALYDKVATKTPFIKYVR